MKELLISPFIIETKVKEWVLENIGSNFVFREHQLEAIVNIVSNIVNEKENTHTQIIEAPTGSGKSLIVIISAGVLWDFYKKTSYILCSDLYLWDQYASFIKSHKTINDKYGQIKGQTGNYHCLLNNEDIRHSDCRIAKIAWRTLFDRTSAKRAGYGCARYCEYVKARHKAMVSGITLMTYQLYLYMVNVVSKNSRGQSPFPERDIIFCDECHNIPKLVQSQYSPTIKFADLDKLLLLYRYNQKFFMNDLFAKEIYGDDKSLVGVERKEDADELTNLNEYWKNEKCVLNDFDSLWKIMCDEESSKEKNLEAINNYVKLVMSFKATVDNIDSSLATKKEKKLSISKEDMDNFRLASWWHNYCCSLADFNTAINECGYQYLIKTNSLKNDTKEIVVTYNCAKEDYMCFNYLLKTSPNRVLLSATVGLKQAFDENLGVRFTEEESNLKKIPSTFDFSKSPIYYFSKYKLSYTEKDTSLKCLKPILYNLLINNYKQYKGIIQTASYDLAKEFVKDAPYELRSRLLLYENSLEKTNFIKRHEKSNNTILIGPSLSEGIDLPGDLCRFIIILKVPYASLKDKLVKAKMELFPSWYKADASNTIIQGIGRGNRSKDDWCVTYIVDGCFGQLYAATKEQYPKELQDRIKVI